MDTQPWYREPWPWIVMAGPAVVVVAGIATMVIAATTFDGLVAEDYYKQGLTVDRVLARESRASALGLAAAVQFNEEHDQVRVTLRSAAPPAALRLRLVHPTRAGEDQVAALAAIGPGLYEGRLRAPRAGNWRVKLEDDANTWRLSGLWHTAQASLELSHQ
jgi:hypothetical protein